MKLIKEFYLMLCNLLGSRKGWVFIVATLFGIFKIISEWVWFFCAIAFISTILLEKLFSGKE
jgi:hypothetical protein